MELKHMILKPRLSEKSYKLSNSRVYVIDVPTNANKLSVKQAIELQYGVKVIKINTANIAGKAKRTIVKNGRRVYKGHNNDFSKVYVTLAENNSLPFFEAIEEEEQQAAKLQEEVEKQQAKETKDDKPKRRIGRRAKTDKETA